MKRWTLRILICLTLTLAGARTYEPGVAAPDIEQMLVPRIERTTFDAWLQSLVLPEEQTAAAQAAFEAYDAKAAAIVARERKGDSSNGEDFERRIAVAWGDLDALFLTVMEEFGPLMKEPQPGALRELRIQAALQNFNVFPGYTPYHEIGDRLDLARFARTWFAQLDPEAQLAPDERSRVDSLLDEYSRRLDDSLLQSVSAFRKARLEFWLAVGQGGIDEMRRAWRLDCQAWQPRVQLLQSTANELGELVVEAIGTDMGAVWERELDRAMYPDFFRDPLVNVWDWLRKLSLSEDDRAYVDSACARYDSQLESARTAVIRQVHLERNQEPMYTIELNSLGYEVKSQLMGGVTAFHNEQSRLRRELAIALTRRLGDEHWTFIMSGTRRGEQ